MQGGNGADRREHDERSPESKSNGLPLKSRYTTATKREAAGDGEQYDRRDGNAAAAMKRAVSGIARATGARSTQAMVRRNARFAAQPPLPEREQEEAGPEDHHAASPLHLFRLSGATPALAAQFGFGLVGSTAPLVDPVLPDAPAPLEPVSSGAAALRARHPPAARLRIASLS